MRYLKELFKWDFSIKELNYKAKVTVPHTWNVDDEVMKYRGIAEYKTTFFADAKFSDKTAFLTFNAVYHNARVYVNNTFVGEHKRSGYTPFKINITDKVIFGENNKVNVEVDNTHTENMLPHKDDFDWADDGGIIRKVELSFIENDSIEFVHITTNIEKIESNLCSGKFSINTAFLDEKLKNVKVSVYDYSDHKKVYDKLFGNVKNNIECEFDSLKLWSPYNPNLYIVTLETENDIVESRIGLRTIEVRGEKVLLNKKEIYLKGCEWMPGSLPDCGSAEPLSHSIKCLRRLKNAGCVFTRFHWQQDDTLFDWCDENGLLVQEEIPYWGYPKKATPLQLEIAKEQADEMVYFHFNHPSIVCFGVGNELGGETEPTIKYVETMYTYFKSKDSSRLVNYVSNSISRYENAKSDDATLHGDIAMWNDYLGLWEPSINIKNHAIRTCKKAKGMPLLVSEFGLCEPHFKGGDKKRSKILEERLPLYEKIENICGYMWFSLNDYRTHCGEEGKDKMKRRIHGSTDLYGNEKPSYRLLTKLQEK